MSAYPSASQDLNLSHVAKLSLSTQIVSCSYRSKLLRFGIGVSWPEGEPLLTLFVARLQVQLPLPQNESARVETLRSLRILGTSCEQVFDDIAHLAALICDASVAIIAFIDEQRVWFKAKIGLELDEIPRDCSFCAYAILQPGVLIVPDALSDERFMSSFLVKQIGIQFYAGIPLVTDDAHPVGALAVMDRVPHLMTAEQSDSLRILARRIMRELELRRTTETQPQHGQPRLVPRPKRSITILIVEDDDNLRNILHRALEGYGFYVFPAAESAEALRLCQQHTIDLVVTDIALPGLNGIELSERIRAARPDMMFLFVTGFGDQFPELGELIRSGAANILEKPFLPSELLRRVEDTLNRGNTAPGTEG
jgi:CheY-like chemotaxis protein